MPDKVIEHYDILLWWEGQNELTITRKCVRCQRVWSAIGWYGNEEGIDIRANGARKPFRTDTSQPFINSACL